MQDTQEMFDEDDRCPPPGAIMVDPRPAYVVLAGIEPNAHDMDLPSFRRQAHRCSLCETIADRAQILEEQRLATHGVHLPSGLVVSIAKDAAPRAHTVGGTA